MDEWSLVCKRLGTNRIIEHDNNMYKDLILTTSDPDFDKRQLPKYDCIDGIKIRVEEGYFISVLDTEKYPIAKHIQDQIVKLDTSGSGKLLISRTFLKWIDRTLGQFQPKSGTVWTLREQIILERSLDTYREVEKHERWRLIASEVATKTIRQCVARYIYIRAQLRMKQANPTPTNAIVITEHETTWTDAQQKALDQALLKYPASMPKTERWKAIGKSVEGQSAKSCLKRYNDVRIRLQIAKKMNDASSQTQSGNVEASQDNKINLNPVPMGELVRLHELNLINLAWCYVNTLTAHVICNSCKRIYSISVRQNTTEKHTCKCHNEIQVDWRPVVLHGSGDSSCGYIDCIGGTVQNILSLEMMICCGKCGETYISPVVEQMALKEISCHHCYDHCTINFHASIFQSVNSQVTTTFYGRHLPLMGTCTHYPRSHRWLSFPCCGESFPCDKCHSTRCNTSTEWATRQICGYCSREQTYSVNRPCTCCKMDIGGGQRRSSHWEGGLGCRNQTLMSKNDNKKYRNSKLKTRSNKLKSVSRSSKAN